jgi:hypothetical protein
VHTAKIDSFPSFLGLPLQQQGSAAVFAAVRSLSQHSGRNYRSFIAT